MKWRHKSCWKIFANFCKPVKGILIYSKAMLEEAVSLSEEHDIHPQVEEVYAWEDAPKAFERLRSQDFVGKIVVRV